MKLRQIIGLLVLIFTIGSFESKGQIDSVFWFAAPWVTPSHSGNTPIVLRISTFNAPTTVRVYQPAGTYDSTFVVPANSLNSHFLTSIVNTLESKPADNVLNYGIKIEADTLVTIVYEVVTTGNNPETYSLKGQNAVGTEFVCPFQTTWANGSYAPIQPKSMICIVATEDNTTVWITPKATVVGHPAGVTYSIVLNRGQVYTVENTSQATNTPGNNLGGTIVVADKPIAVTVSDDSVTNSGGGCRDLMGDQIVPVDVVGTNYIVNRGNMFANSQEGIFIVATQNFTSVTVTTTLGTFSQLLNQGDTWKYVLTATEGLAYVDADKNVYVLQASGFGCEVGEALLPPINCAGSSQVSFTRTNAQTFILNILCPTSAINNFLLNGSNTLVPGSAFLPVPGTAGFWSGAQIDFPVGSIPVGTSNLLTNSSDFFGMGVINGGAGTGCYYHYMSAFNRKVYTKAGNDTTLCNGDPSVLLNGSVEGGSTTGEWTVINGAGSFVNATDLTTSYVPSTSDYTQGTLTFVLASTGNCDPVRDTMIVNFIQSPEANAGTDDSYCKNNVGAVPITGAFSYSAAATWSGGDGGAFGNIGSPTTTYTPSPADLAADSVVLFYTTAGSFFSCPNKQDTVVIFFTDAPTIDAGPDQLVCSNTTDVALNAVISTGSGTWTSSGTGGFSPSQTTLNGSYVLATSDISNGLVMLYLVSDNNGNCAAVFDSLEIQIINFPVVTNTTTDSICSNNGTLNLTGTVTSGFSTQWTTSGFGTIANPSNLSTIYSISPVDVTNGFIDVVLSTTGICPIANDSIRVIFVSPPQVNAGTDQAYCQNALVQLNGQITGADTTGTWSTLGTGTFLPGPNFLNGVYDPSIGDVSGGPISLILTSTSNFGCPPDRDTIVITFNRIPTADFTYANVCQASNMNFVDASVANTGSLSTWSWAFGDNTNSIAQNPQHAYTTPGNFNVMMIVTSSNGCTDTVVKPVTVYPLPLPSFNASIACEAYPTNFTNTSFIPSGSIVSYLYDFNGIGTSSQSNPSFVFPTSGTYNVTLTAVSNFGCTNSVIQQIVVHAIPNASFTATPNPALVNQNITYTDVTAGNIISWQWNFGDGQGDNIQITNHSYNAGGVYTVTLTITDDIGCMDTISKDISVALLPVVPSGFTPNGDGENDVFIIRGGPFRNVDFKVYNNWGQLIFESNDSSIGWDGTYKGEPAPLGVYTWTFVVDMGSDFIVKESGDVTLIR
ncbi:PKD domain-containing protein [Fluviicola taffensis]|nr:PKD domain-containing protein [Fluviicola taffensis]